jgi:hypothetical protein
VLVAYKQLLVAYRQPKLVVRESPARATTTESLKMDLKFRFFAICFLSRQIFSLI